MIQQYILLLFLLDSPAVQVGPFDNVFACEAALAQVQVVRTRARGVCVNLKAKPHHWNGKQVGK